MATAAETKQFKTVFRSLLDYATGPELLTSDVAEARNWFKKSLEYTNTNIYPFYGQMVVTFYKQICPNYTEDELYLAQVLGCCLEIWKNAGMIADDYLDGQMTREGKPTWHCCIGDADMLPLDCGFFYCVVYKLLKKHFGKKPYYVRMFDFFRDSTFWEFVAACQDLKSDWKSVTTVQCEKLNKVKSHVYMCVPIVLAMMLAGVTDDNDYEEIQQMFRYIGHWQQDQNDYVDFYGEVMGTDIQQGHCTWLFGQALAKCSKEQHKILKDNYGKEDSDCVEAVKHLYEELSLKELFTVHQKTRHNKILEMIEKYDGMVPKEVLFNILKAMDNFKYV